MQRNDLWYESLETFSVYRARLGLSNAATYAWFDQAVVKLFKFSFRVQGNFQNLKLKEFQTFSVWSSNIMLGFALIRIFSSYVVELLFDIEILLSTNNTLSSSISQVDI